MMQSVGIAARHRAVVGAVLLAALAWPVVAADYLVVYTSLDRGFSEPILKGFEARMGIEVRAAYDTESTKTVGLANRIRAERLRPRCDVFWNNEILNTLRLQEDGLLQPCRPSNASLYPAQFQDQGGSWYGFAARARVLIVHNELVPEGQEPRSILDLTAPRWRGQVGIAKPLFGTTASHVACLFACLGPQNATDWLKQLKDNGVHIMAGNKACAEAVGAGRLACALTDTDDALLEIAAGHLVRIVYLDTAAEQIGTLFIPNTLSVVRGAPHPKEAEQLIDYLLSPEVERMLAEGPSGQIPLNNTFQGTLRVKTPAQVKPMAVDFAQAAAQFQDAARWIEEHFLN